MREASRILFEDQLYRFKVNEVVTLCLENVHQSDWEPDRLTPARPGNKRFESKLGQIKTYLGIF